MKNIINKLVKNKDLTDKQFLQLFEMEEEQRQYLFNEARKIALENFGNKIYLRALIEISNTCQNDCFYCGIRCSNQKVNRYHLTKDAIMACAKKAYDNGFRTFVLQGGEEDYYTDEMMCAMIKELKTNFKDAAITLSLGEKTEESYRKYFEAGANRYLLRHETIVEKHYQKLHPPTMQLENRISCLQTLKKIGFQTGAGIMVNSPYQKKEYIVQDIRFLQDLQPEMIGIGPFLPHQDTPFKHMEKGCLEDVLVVLAILRILFPKVLLPATTALASLQEGGREAGILAGANVVMPNISPEDIRKDYDLYDHKVSLGAESLEGIQELERNLNTIGYEISWGRGDYQKEEENV